MKTLLLQRRFAPLFWTQFLSAFNDNFLKNALIFLIMFKLSEAQAESLITLASGLFILPFFLLSGLGGEMADRYDKSRVAQRLKLSEFGAAALSVAGFSLSSVEILFLALFFFGVISALFGPIKYGILPDHLRKEELPIGNALIEGATFIAILLGTVAGGLSARNGGNPAHFAYAMILISILCYGASLFIPKTGQAAPDLKVDANIFRSTLRLLEDLWGEVRIWRAGIMVSFFWMFGVIALSLLPPTIKMQLGGNEMAVSLSLALFAVAVAIGSWLGAFFCHGRINLKPTPIATVVIAVAAADLAFVLHGAPPTPERSLGAFFSAVAAWRVGVDFAVMAAAGGVLAVPSFAAAQTWAPVERRARVVAAINVLNAAFMVIGTAAVAALQAAGLDLGGAFALLALSALASAAWIFRYLPNDDLASPAKSSL